MFTCEQYIAINSRQTGVGAGVGVDMKIPTPESESTPMKTLSTPQPCKNYTGLRPSEKHNSRKI